MECAYRLEVVGADTDDTLDVSAGVIGSVVADVGSEVRLAQGGRERPEAKPRRFWADQRSKTGGRSRPPCARRENCAGLAASSTLLIFRGLAIPRIALRTLGSGTPAASRCSASGRRLGLFLGREDVIAVRELVALEVSLDRAMLFCCRHLVGPRLVGRLRFSDVGNVLKDPGGGRAWPCRAADTRGSRGADGARRYSPIAPVGRPDSGFVKHWAKRSKARSALRKGLYLCGDVDQTTVSESDEEPPVPLKEGCESARRKDALVDIAE